ncbi:GtrA family protein [Nocardia crassostreae]|uniref:GtrA family protein n=1 Tax=Nocardia crassostreae TaxID=53428 RepID=UPI000A0538B5|nr:GtrA family protein [Nocardia crassostreae]
MAVLDIPQQGVSPLPVLVNTYAYGAQALSAYGADVRVAGNRWAGQLGAWLRGENAFAQLIRFALVGGLSNISYVLLFLALSGSGPLQANLAGSVVSTMLANELHRRLTFHAGERVTWFTAQLEGGGLALAGLAITSAALAILETNAPGLGDVMQALAVLAITAVVGGMRFVSLRLWVFRAPAN